MTDAIYYSLPSRNEIMKRAVRECADTMFRLATPSTTLEELEKQYSELPPEDKDELLQDRYYLPMELQSEIIDHFLYIYRLENKWSGYQDIIRDFMMNEHMYSKPKSKDENASIDERLGIGRLPSLESVIGASASKAVGERFDLCKKEFNRSADESTFRWRIFNISPMSNKERVEEYWRANGQPDFTIDESKYNEENIKDDDE